ncbi:MAG: rod shape-determining protein MreC [Phycisphaerae bacterium]
MAGERDGQGKRLMFAGLMAASAVAAWAPARWTNWTKGVTQLEAPAQALVQAIGARLARAAGLSLETAASKPAVSAEEQALRDQLVFQAGLTAQLEAQNAQLRDLRANWVRRSVRLVPARVVARDIVAARDTVVLGQGSARGVRWADWIASRVFVDRGADEGLAEGYTVLSRESLVGRVELVQPYVARVRLLSDAGSRTAARVGRIENGTLKMIDHPLTLQGGGGGRMLIRDVPLSWVEEPGGAASPAGPELRIRAGDVVTSAPGEQGLEAPLAIGTVSAVVIDPRRRLVASVEVQSIVQPDQLRDVFVIVAGPAEAEAAP